MDSCAIQYVRTTTCVLAVGAVITLAVGLAVSRISETGTDGRGSLRLGWVVVATEVAGISVWAHSWIRSSNLHGSVAGLLAVAVSQLLDIVPELQRDELAFPAAVGLIIVNLTAICVAGYRRKPDAIHRLGEIPPITVGVDSQGRIVQRHQPTLFCGVTERDRLGTLSVFAVFELGVGGVGWGLGLYMLIPYCNGATQICDDLRKWILFGHLGLVMLLFLFSGLEYLVGNAYCWTIVVMALFTVPITALTRVADSARVRTLVMDVDRFESRKLQYVWVALCMVIVASYCLNIALVVPGGGATQRGEQRPSRGVLLLIHAGMVGIVLVGVGMGFAQRRVCSDGGGSYVTSCTSFDLFWWDFGLEVVFLTLAAITLFSKSEESMRMFAISLGVLAINDYTRISHMLFNTKDHLDLQIAGAGSIVLVLTNYCLIMCLGKPQELHTEIEALPDIPVTSMETVHGLGSELSLRIARIYGNSFFTDSISQVGIDTTISVSVHSKEMGGGKSNKRPVEGALNENDNRTEFEMRDFFLRSQD